MSWIEIDEFETHPDAYFLVLDEYTGVVSLAKYDEEDDSIETYSYVDLGDHYCFTHCMHIPTLQPSGI